MQILSLNSFINFLTENTGIQICLHDISGILANENLFAEYKYTIHSSEFCSAAKATRRGLELCMKCKKSANRKAVFGGEYFCGNCAYGLTELAYPVVIDFEVKCIIYVGNVIRDMNFTKQKIDRTCRLTGADPEKLKALLSGCKKAENSNVLFELARMTESYIVLILNKNESNKKRNGTPWIVRDLKQYIETKFSESISLKDCAALYFVNEKYLGRIFQKNIGMSFHKYLNRIRCENAKRRLKNESRTVTEIALECGYSDVTYFNRVFKQLYGLTPEKYRNNQMAAS